MSVARQPDALEQPVEQLPGLADERDALLVLVEAGRLADEHQVGVRVPGRRRRPACGPRRAGSFAQPAVSSAYFRSSSARAAASTGGESTRCYGRSSGRSRTSRRSTRRRPPSGRSSAAAPRRGPRRRRTARRAFMPPQCGARGASASIADKVLEVLLALHAHVLVDRHGASLPTGSLGTGTVPVLRGRPAREPGRPIELRSCGTGQCNLGPFAVEDAEPRRQLPLAADEVAANGRPLLPDDTATCAAFRCASQTTSRSNRPARGCSGQRARGERHDRRRAASISSWNSLSVHVSRKNARGRERGYRRNLPELVESRLEGVTRYRKRRVTDAGDTGTENILHVPGIRLGTGAEKCSNPSVSSAPAVPALRSPPACGSGAPPCARARTGLGCQGRQLVLLCVPGRRDRRGRAADRARARGSRTSAARRRSRARAAPAPLQPPSAADVHARARPRAARRRLGGRHGGDGRGARRRRSSSPPCWAWSRLTSPTPTGRSTTRAPSSPPTTSSRCTRRPRSSSPRAGAPPEALVPLMRRTIENGFELTGPIARGDWATVEAHLAAPRAASGARDALPRPRRRDRGWRMRIVRTIADAARAPLARRAARVGLVPTMGALHAGHLSLFARRARRVRRSSSASSSTRRSSARRGPRRATRATRRATSALAERAGVDRVRARRSEEMYPPASQTWVDVDELARVLEGAFRPGHFRGVATVCLKLFNIVRPDRAYFGQKDAQQVAVLTAAGRATWTLGVEIRVLPTVREPDGLALSSRNARLTPEDREARAALPRALPRALGLRGGGTPPPPPARARRRAARRRVRRGRPLRRPPVLAAAVRVGGDPPHRQRRPQGGAR